MQLPVLTIRDAVERQLCTGCGACAAMAPGTLAMCDAIDHGRRPTPTEITGEQDVNRYEITSSEWAARGESDCDR